MKYFSQIPKSVADLTMLGEEMQDGLTKLAESLGIIQVTAAQMEAATDAMVNADDAFNLSRSLQETAYKNFHLAEGAVTGWLGKVTGVLSTFFGKRWNRQWVQVGFINPSIEIPDIISDRLALALRVIHFLTVNPGYEAPNQGVTAAIGTSLRASATSTQLLASEADANVSNNATARDNTVTALTSHMRMLIGVLAELLEPNDANWLAFGLVKPGTLTTPAAPAGLTITAGPMEELSDPDTVVVLAFCDATAFATRYRFRMRNAGIPGSKYSLIASTTGPMAQITIPASAPAEFIVQAVNGNRQSVASEPVVYTVPVLAPAAESVAKLALAPAPVKLEGNGNGAATNGRRSLSRTS